MNYIKQLQADKAEAVDSARSTEAAINHLISYLSCPNFTSIQWYRSATCYETYYLLL